MQIRTDLAVEAHEMCRKEAKQEAQIPGVEVKIEEEKGVSITRVTILNEQGKQALGKEIGNYITIEAPDIKYSTEEYETTCYLIAKELKAMANLKEESVILVVGLGNRQITPDALGSEAVSQLMVTHHMKKHMPEHLDEGVRSVCAIAPGVLGTTGMETVEIIKGVTQRLKPDLIIAIDALAAGSLERISTTFQLTDTGIQPGAGVGNNREGLNEETLGAPVLAIGVPTVVDAVTIAATSLQPEDESQQAKLAQQLRQTMKSMVVTPNDIDLVIQRVSKTVANGINLALHQDFTLEDVQSYVG